MSVSEPRMRALSRIIKQNEKKKREKRGARFAAVDDVIVVTEMT